MEEDKKTKELSEDNSITVLQSINDKSRQDEFKSGTRKDSRSNYPTNPKEDQHLSVRDNSDFGPSDTLSIASAIEEEDLEKIPPNFEDARIHQNAQRVKNLDSNKDNKGKIQDKRYYCQCCKMPTTNTQPLYPLCQDTKILEDLGIGYPLYFLFKKYIGCIYAVIVLCISVVGLVLYSNPDNGEEWMGPDENAPFIIRVSIGNIGKIANRYESGDVNIMIIISTIILTAIFISYVLFQQFQKDFINKIDEGLISPADFTVMVSNIPHDKNKADLKTWLCKHVETDEKEVIDINLCYDIHSEVKEIQKIIDLKKLVQNYDLLSQKQKMKYTKNQLRKEIKQKEKNVGDIKQRILDDNSKDQFTGKAFVVFNNQADPENLINEFKRSLIRRIYNHIVLKWLKVKSERFQDDRWWDGKRIDIERAAEPTNIYWENMAVKPNERFWRSLATYGVAFICLAIVFAINLGLSFARDALDDEVNSSNNNETRIYAMIIVISFISSIFIAINNTILFKVIRYISQFERHETYTKMNLTVSVKLTVCVVINTGVIPLIVNLGKKRWFGRSGLAIDMFFILLAINFITPSLSLFNVVHFWRKFRYWYEERKGEKSSMTQREANQLAEGVDWNPPYYYATSVSILIITCFYTPLIPLLAIISFFGLIYKYWVEKYVLLRRCKIPQELGEQMAIMFIGVIPLCLFFYSLGQFIFIQTLSEGKNQLPWIPLGMMILAVLVVSPVLAYLDLQTKVKRDEKATFEKYKNEFLTDYNRSNPITSDDAIQDHIQSLQKLRTVRNTNHLLTRFKESIRAKIFPALANGGITMTNMINNTRDLNNSAEELSRDMDLGDEEEEKIP
ncbi:unnamed protein product [Moneuplotes crassus]|uniref:CSC1/OSCA1-like cytosolic domain-containing protein n=1 Tax=Euplotes crassus TaxID=5936 RepID=A0AAD1Y4J8_EUPCR|nr:unnamed protein product [Moneuplotes crassus]